MHSLLFLAQTLAALSTASFIPFPFNAQDNACAAIQFVAPAFPLQSDAAQSFCKSVFRIQTSTVTEVATVVQRATSTSFGTTTVTAAPDRAQATYSTQTCYQNTLTASPANKHKRELEAEAAPQREPLEDRSIVDAAIWGFDSTNQLSSVCSCYDVNFCPSTTVSSTMTSTSVVATVTKITTINAADSQTPSISKSGVYATYIQPNGTYVAADGIYTDYSGYDFYGYDLVSGPCGAASDRVSTSAGKFACDGLNACQDVCASYNLNKAASDPACLGITWQSASLYCYLKNAVPGNGAPNCAPILDKNCQSAIKGKVVPPY